MSKSILITGIVAVYTFLCCCALALSSKCIRFRQPFWQHESGDVALLKSSLLSSVKSRRDFAAQMIVGGIVFAPSVSLATESASLAADKINLVDGHSRLTYLLDNWEAETTVCGRGDNPYVTDAGCERTPLKVMDYLGYRNTKHPLFKADKMLQRLEVLVPTEYEAEYLDAIEKWIESADEGNGMAYISSWGEANPGGGKDRVLLFIQRAKKNVVDARDSLATAIRILDL
jgi:hypothetical protein